jgi:hypothetical protein
MFVNAAGYFQNGLYSSVAHTTLRSSLLFIAVHYEVYSCDSLGLSFKNKLVK